MTTPAISKNLRDPLGSKPLRVRVAPVNYLAAILILTFLGAFLLYLGQETLAFAFLGLIWTVTPLLAFTDTIVFDGRRLRRTGLVPRLFARAMSLRDRIKLSDIEQVQTLVVQTIRRGGNDIYVYRTLFTGKGVSMAVQSSRANYRQMVEAILPRLNATLLDRRSAELRDNIVDRIEARQLARAAEIPSVEVLESSLKRPSGTRSATHVSGESAVSNESIEKAEMLHRLGNQLRVTGLLPQAIEAFRRAVVLMPLDARLLYDFALCLNTYAGAKSDRQVGRRALAMMRLAERRAGDDGELLVEIGEGYFHFGEWDRAAAAFRKAIERVGEKFRSKIGLAEIALHEGKIAHVIHNFSAARDLAETTAIRRWTDNEIHYFSRLNDDDEYMELEISRMNLLDTLETIKRSALKIAVVGMPAIVAGLALSDAAVANVGWAVSIISLVVWVAVIILGNMLSARIPYDLVEND